MVAAFRDAKLATGTQMEKGHDRIEAALSSAYRDERGRLSNLSRKRSGENCVEDLARLRRIARNIIKADKSRMARVRRKQRMAVMKPSYLEAIF